MRPLLEVVRRLLRAVIFGARALREPLAAGGAVWRRACLWALGLLPVLLAVSLGRTIFDPTSQGYRAAHPAIGGSWTGRLAASVPPQPRRDPFESEASYELGVRSWRAEIDAVAADIRGIWVDLPPLIISRKLRVTMCAPNGAIARFTTTIDALDNDHLRALTTSAPVKSATWT